VKEHTWCIKKDDTRMYVHTNIPHPEGGFRTGRLKKDGSRGRTKRQVTLALHRFIMNTQKGTMIDHINRNCQDNRKSNLRMCSNSQNQQNKRKGKNNTSGYKGVTLQNNNLPRPWMAQIEQKTSEGRKHIYLGHHATPEEAAKAYDKGAKELHGEFAYLNFSEEK